MDKEVNILIKAHFQSWAIHIYGRGEISHNTLERFAIKKEEMHFLLSLPKSFSFHLKDCSWGLMIVALIRLLPNSWTHPKTVEWNVSRALLFLCLLILENLNSLFCRNFDLEKRHKWAVGKSKKKKKWGLGKAILKLLWKLMQECCFLWVWVCGLFWCKDYMYTGFEVNVFGN